MVYNYYDCYCYCLLYVNESVECVELLIDKIRGDYIDERKSLSSQVSPRLLGKDPHGSYFIHHKTRPLY